ncbi:TRAP transporter small permease subunit [Oceanispirochaeta crateris]|uniref:TRAP transporter small permease subunit n=1 Tax=Oceanispirochaeta crateris TaxID=2518645 RepID=A0A5C1QFB5_9SPIO|nr:TRAP transporter small permease subunit [Oceanispirochaeta crateris]QEN06725.1 TRAP transporter small permease subunit [Oceanispirochaeta crateris]
MKKFLRFLHFTEIFVEEIVPAIFFTILFLVFVVQIIFRYALNSPLTWPYEVTVISYIWVAILSAGYARKYNENVAFTVVYDKLKEKGKCWFRIIGNVIVTLTYIILLPPSWKYISFIKIKKSAVLRIPLSYVFFPFLIFLILIIIYSIIDIVKDYKSLKNMSQSKLGKGSI